MSDVYRIVGGQCTKLPAKCDAYCIAAIMKPTDDSPAGCYSTLCVCDGCKDRKTRPVMAGPLDGAKVAWPEDRIAVWIPTVDSDDARYSLYESTDGACFRHTGSIRPDELEVEREAA